MSELSKAKRRIKQLEKCLDDVLNLLAVRAEEIERFSPYQGKDPEIETLTAAINRIGRTKK